MKSQKEGDPRLAGPNLG